MWPQTGSTCAPQRSSLLSRYRGPLSAWLLISLSLAEIKAEISPAELDRGQVQATSCVRFFTFVVELDGRDPTWRTMPRTSGPALMASGSFSAPGQKRLVQKDVMQALVINTKSLALSQTCFELHVFSDSKTFAALGTDMKRVHPSLFPRTLPELKRNPLGDPYTSWIALCWARLDVAQHFLNRGEKAIWIDLDTLIMHDLSIPFHKFGTFAVCGYTTNRNEVSGRYYQSLISQGPLEEQCYGDLWMVDNGTAARMYEFVHNMARKGALPKYDVQTMWSTVLRWSRQFIGNRTAYFNNLRDSLPVCWGFDWMHNSMAPYINRTFSYKNGVATHYKLLQVDGVTGRLMCGEKGHPPKAIGALSFTWHSFVETMQDPDDAFRDPSVRQWIRTHLAL